MAPLPLMKVSFNSIQSGGWPTGAGLGGWGGGRVALSQVPTEPPRKSDTLLMDMGVSGLAGPWVGFHICTE